MYMYTNIVEEDIWSTCTPCREYVRIATAICKGHGGVHIYLQVFPFFFLATTVSSSFARQHATACGTLPPGATVMETANKLHTDMACPPPLPAPLSCTIVCALWRYHHSSHPWILESAPASLFCFTDTTSCSLSYRRQECSTCMAFIAMPFFVEHTFAGRQFSPSFRKPRALSYGGATSFSGSGPSPV